MAKCGRCGRGGLFRKLNENGLCADCATLDAIEKRQIHLTAAVHELENKLENKQEEYEQLKKEAKEAALLEAEKDLQAVEIRRQNAETARIQAQTQAEEAAADAEKREKAAQASIRKAQRGRELLKAIQHACDWYDEVEFATDNEATHKLLNEVTDFITPTVELDLQCLNVRDLRKRYRENEKQIRTLLEKYQGRYTTKANMTIYKLMVIALEAELQNILYALHFGKLEDALDNVRKVTKKYFTIAVEGNQSIAPTMRKFIGEIEYYFCEAVRIEYEYYVKKERAKEEQRAIREQMRQEAEERRELERQKAQIEKEESKFHEQIGQLNEQMEHCEEAEKLAQLQIRVEELQRQLAAVSEQKDKIINLQNGKAGNVYVISNIGSFGEDVFKIGMTRRLDPMERVNELSSASVPFPFDVHSMIFSNDAVSLETNLHHILNDKRVNKVNLRKEFFHVSLDELEELVEEIAPTAEFRRTVLAEQYRQSLSIDKVVEKDILEESFEEDCDEED